MGSPGLPRVGSQKGGTPHARGWGNPGPREPSRECVPGETNAEPDALTREDFLGEGRTFCRDGLGMKQPAPAQPRAKGRVRLREREPW